jgi:CspA family cold shock protein
MRVMTTGLVQEWHAEQGWGVITSAATPTGCWAHFSSIDVPGYRELRPGGSVTFDYEAADQDGYRFRALRVWPEGLDPTAATHRREPPASPSTSAYQSVLTIRMDDGRVYVGDAAHKFLRREAVGGHPDQTPAEEETGEGCSAGRYVVRTGCFGMRQMPSSMSTAARGGSTRCSRRAWT